MTKHKVVISGMGIVGALGQDSLCDTKEEFWRSIHRGESAIKSWQPQGTDDYPVKYAATIDFDDFSTRFQSLLSEAPLLERRGYFGLVAAINAFSDAGLTPSMRVGCVASSGVPEIHESEVLALTRSGDYPESLNTHKPLDHSGLMSTNDRMVAAIAERLEIDGPVVNINGACAGAAQAIGLAFRAIQRGEVDAMLAGGADSVTNTRVMSGLYLLGATASSSSKKEALCCPFDKGRSGLVAGEGGAFLVLESEASAKARGATIYARVLGYGSSMDAYKVTAPHPDGEGAKAAMLAALKDAQVSARDIDYINAHGTSTPLNDLVETRVIKEVFDAMRASYPLVSSTKSMIGHWISAAAAPEVMATALAIHHSIIPPTINLVSPDQECNLDYVANHARQHKIRFALSNSFGFGGINACLALGLYDKNS